MLSKKVPGVHPSPPAAVQAPTSSSPVHTPTLDDVGDGATGYEVHGEREPSDGDDLEGRGYLRRDESEDATTSVGPDVEMRSAAEIQADEARQARNRRLTLLQLDRFRRAIAANKGKHARRSSSSRWEAKARRGEGFDSVFAETPEAPDALRELRIVSYPYAHWVLGALLIIAASVFADHIHKKAIANKKLELSSVNWWKYLVAGLIYVFAALVIAHGRIETFVMDKDLLIVRIRATKPLRLIHRTRIVEKELRQILDVRVETSGEILSGEVDTRAYKVHLDFDDGTHATTLESRSKKKALVRCRLIKQFLLSCAPSESDVGSPLSGSDSTSGSDAAPSPTSGLSIVLPARSASSNLTLAVPAPLAMLVAQANESLPSPRRVMMVAAVPSSLSQKSVGKPPQPPPHK